MNPTSWVPHGSDERPSLVINRLRAVLFHVPFYSIRGAARLASDCGVSPSTISRILQGKSEPSFRVTQSITMALSERLGRTLDCNEIFSLTGSFPTESVCALIGCCGCLPPEAWDANNQIKPEWQDAKPGDWCWFPSHKQKHLSSREERLPSNQEEQEQLGEGLDLLSGKRDASSLPNMAPGRTDLILMSPIVSRSTTAFQTAGTVYS